MKILIATGFYYEVSKKEKRRPSNAFRGNTACKDIEFFSLWYRQVRKFLPNEDVLILDNGSPIPFSSVRQNIPEKVEEMSSDLKFNRNAKINSLRLEKRLKHHKGWCRQIKTILETSLINNYEALIYIEADALLGFNPQKYLKYDFVSRGDWGNGKGVQQAFMIIKNNSFKFIKKLNEIYNHIEEQNLTLDKEIINLYKENFAEIGFKKQFWTTNSCFLKKEDEVLHDSNEETLLKFIKNQQKT
ncbi:MAG: hypothetical protein CL512_03870 [Actinobacteria bacterium]|nr:hypothetical protein [Actinomycetota bacterium]